MEFVFRSGGVPVKSWIDADQYYGSADLGKQTENCSRLPMAYHHFALMPDAHSGFGMPIGGVLALSRALCPAAVGYDIGCGMIAANLNIKREQFLKHRADIGDAVRECLEEDNRGARAHASRFAAHYQRRLQDDNGFFARTPHYDKHILVNSETEENIEIQLGTLGGGNHFVEFDFDEDGDVWLVIHSGSRGVGKHIADHYMKNAVEMNGRWWSTTSKGLECLPIDSVEGQVYQLALKFALQWASFNRALMMDEIIVTLGKFYGHTGVIIKNLINVHHNDASIENHFGHNIWIHRKGATRARLNEPLVIPGNMGQGTVICHGLGNPDSFCSSSHGAGRPMSRSAARNTLDFDEEMAKLEAADVMLITPDATGVLDEMPGAYKDLDVVMKAQEDLVVVDHRLHPMLVFKGVSKARDWWKEQDNE